MLFIRHAQTDMAGRFCGHADPVLNEQGQAQAASLAEMLAGEPILQVLSSDLRRARQTADTLARERRLPVEERAALREIDFGQWEGRRWEEIEALDPQYAAAWVSRFPRVPAPQGEHFAAFQARVLKEVHSILDNVHGLTAVVTHAGVLRVILTHLFGCSEPESWEQTKPYCCVLRYACEAIGEKQ